MERFKVVTYPNKVLRQKAARVREIGQEEQKLVPRMLSTMIDYDGVGLAAPQVGISRQVILVMTPEGALACFNPEILRQSKESSREEEGCLSLPGLFMEVKRAETLTVRYETLEGEKVEMEVSGLVARIFQHEIDHLNGKLIIHRQTPMKRWKLRKDLAKIKKQS